MKKTKSLIFLVSILIMIAVVLMTFKNTVFAENTSTDGIDIEANDDEDTEDDSDSTEEDDEEESTNNVIPQTITISNSNTNTTNNTSSIGISNNNTNQSNVTSMPKTGIKENVEIVLLAGVVSTFYFYKKYKKYYKL